MNERVLIVNADDFGMTEAGDEAILSLFQAGRITSSTILTPAKRASEACFSAAERGLAVGVHWTLHAEWEQETWLPSAGAERVPSLCENGAMIPSSARASKAAKSADMSRELEAQYRFMVEQGVVPDHADSHGGTLYGINGRLFFLNAFRLCKRYGLPFRFPRRSDFLRRQFGHEPNSALKAAHRLIVASADCHGVKLIDDFITNPYPVAKIEGYASLAAYYEREIASAKEGITEVFLHPSLPDAALLARKPEWQKRIWEYEYLTSDAFENLLWREGFVLSSWGSAPFKQHHRR
ncbi:MAG: ChbG/HpnK family deacetylase [Clostridiaceae bacterium]